MSVVKCKPTCRGDKRWQSGVAAFGNPHGAGAPRDLQMSGIINATVVWQALLSACTVWCEYHTGIYHALQFKRHTLKHWVGMVPTYCWMIVPMQQLSCFKNRLNLKNLGDRALLGVFFWKSRFYEKYNYIGNLKSKTLIS